MAKQGKKEKNLAFLDAEYLSARYRQGHIEDVISVGMVITDPQLNELERFYSTVQLVKGHRLPPLIINLTGLTNEELMKAPSYEEVMGQIVGLMSKHHVDKVCVWGGDKTNFQRDFESRRLDKGLSREISKFINSFENIQKDVSHRLTDGLDQGLSLADMKAICGLGGHVEHNALSDAEDMLNCIRIVNSGTTAYDGVEAAQYKHFRADYVKNRSFGEEEEDEAYRFSSATGEQLLRELKDRGFDQEPKTKAFMDDLEYLLGLGNVHMGTFAEMIEEENV